MPTASFILSLSKSILKEILDGLIGNHLLIENIGTGLWALNHFDNF